jgi:hypothetical protein
VGQACLAAAAHQADHGGVPREEAHERLAGQPHRGARQAAHRGAQEEQPVEKRQRRGSVLRGGRRVGEEVEEDGGREG